MTALLDVNALIALAWPNHVHHEATRRWFAMQRANGWATCAVTEAGFVRVSCNPSAVRHSVTPGEAIALLHRLRQLESHAFWPLDRSITDLPKQIVGRIQGYRQITDAVLLAAAMQRGGTLATLDSGLARLADARQHRAVQVIPV
ncbi:MAG: PIN domain-containing protein [Candidatus Tectomicrobia bacterium]|nr:PIN domain-containing protein [Candidatus Tectomicrobia bacterium]